MYRIFKYVENAQLLTMRVTAYALFMIDLMFHTQTSVHSKASCEVSVFHFTFSTFQHVYGNFHIWIQLDIGMIYTHGWKIKFRLPGCVCSCDLFGPTQTVIPISHWFSLAHVYIGVIACHAIIIFNIANLLLLLKWLLWDMRSYNFEQNESCGDLAGTP